MHYPLVGKTFIVDIAKDRLTVIAIQIQPLGLHIVKYVGDDYRHTAQFIHGRVQHFFAKSQHATQLTTSQLMGNIFCFDAVKKNLSAFAHTQTARRVTKHQRLAIANKDVKVTPILHHHLN